MASDASEASVLRAKYLDWCSARIAELFLQYSPEQIYELAQQAEEGARRRGSVSLAGGVAVGEIGGGSGAGTGEGTEYSYRGLVEGVTAELAERLMLPSLADWVEAYRSEPERYEAEISGLWREP